PPATQGAEPTPPALAAAPEFAPWPVEAEATAMIEPEPLAESDSVAEATPAPLPGKTLAQESTLLASFEQMEIRPFPPPEEGTAESQSAEAYFDPTDFLFGPEPEPDPAAFLLDPAPPLTQKAVLPQSEFVPAPSEPPQPEPPTAETPQAVTTEVERPGEPTS